MPTTEDDGKSITCRAENPNVTGLFLETSWKIDVVCKYSFRQSVLVFTPQNLNENLLYRKSN